MKSGKKIFFLLVYVFALSFVSFSQVIVPLEIAGNGISKKESTTSVINYLKNKQLPAGYEQEVKIALTHFPELQSVPVKFRVKKSFCTLKTRPSFLSTFMRKGHRTYIIIISAKTVQKLMPLTFANLPEDARIGAIGHELSHVVDFSKKSMWQSFKIATGHLNKYYLDSLEFNTDKICIKHGLGKELEAWSRHVRNTMHTTYWRGANFVNRGDTLHERYMNPATIEKYIEEEGPVSESTTVNAH